MNRAAVEAVQAASSPLSVPVLPTALAVMASLDRSVSEIHMLGLVMLVALAWFGFRTERSSRVFKTDRIHGRLRYLHVQQPGFILCSLVMVTVALVALFASYAVLSLVVPGYEGFAITAPAFVLAVFHYLLYDFVERMIAWRPGKPPRNGGR